MRKPKGNVVIVVLGRDEEEKGRRLQAPLLVILRTTVFRHGSTSLFATTIEKVSLFKA